MMTNLMEPKRNKVMVNIMIGGIENISKIIEPQLEIQKSLSIGRALLEETH